VVDAQMKGRNDTEEVVQKSQWWKSLKRKKIKTENM